MKYPVKSIFLSHVWTDKDFANHLADDLRLRGIRVWIDEAEIKLGDSLIEKIRHGIDEMDYLGVVLSPNSVNSEWVKKEVDIAMNHEIEGKRVKVLPLLHKKCDLPGFLKGKLYADFTTKTHYNAGLLLLIQRLGADAGHVDGTLIIFRKDTWSKFTYVNDNFAKTFNVTKEQILGKSDRDFYPSALAKQYVESDMEVIESGKAFASIEQHRSPDGELRRVHVIKCPIRDDNGTIVGVEGIYWTPKLPHYEKSKHNSPSKAGNRPVAAEAARRSSSANQKSLSARNSKMPQERILRGHKRGR